MKLDIISDTICPWCYIGKRRLERALAVRPVPALEIEWRPFQLNPDMPAEGMDRAQYLAAKFGGADAAERIYEPVRAVGREERIDFAFERMARVPNAVASHRLIRRAGELGRQDALVEAMFTAYFTEAADIGQPDSLVAIAEAAGLDADDTRAYLATERDRDAIEAEDAMARSSGISGVPAFIFDRRYLISGAQDPAVFHEVFDRLSADAATADAAPA